MPEFDDLEILLDDQMPNDGHSRFKNNQKEENYLHGSQHEFQKGPSTKVYSSHGQISHNEQSFSDYRRVSLDNIQNQMPQNQILESKTENLYGDGNSPRIDSANKTSVADQTLDDSVYMLVPIFR